MTHQNFFSVELVNAETTTDSSKHQLYCSISVSTVKCAVVHEEKHMGRVRYSAGSIYGEIPSVLSAVISLVFPDNFEKTVTT
jgi:hypothetical protein